MTPEEQQALINRIATLEAKIAEGNKIQQPAPAQSVKSIVEDFKDLDEDEVKFIKKIEQRVEQKLAPLLSQQQESVTQKTFNEAALKFKGMSEEIVNRAQTLYSHWQKLGGPAAQFKPEEAFKFAIGETELAKVSATEDKPAPVVRQQQVLTNANKPAPATAKTDFSKMNESERYQYLKDKVRNSKL